MEPDDLIGEKGNGIWKVLAVILLSSAVTGFSSWILFGMSKVEYEEMTSFVEGTVKTRLLEYEKTTIPQTIVLNRISDKIDYIILEMKNLKAGQEDVSNRVRELEKNAKSP